VPRAGRVHQRVAVVRWRGTLSVRLRRVVRVLHALALHAPGVQHRPDRGHNHRGRVVGAHRPVVPAVPVGVVSGGRMPEPVGQVHGDGGGRFSARSGLLT